MNYNLHPIFVHFPIALFLLYSALYIFPWPKRLPTVNWQIPRITILIAGLIGAWLSNSTGELAQRLARPDRAILEMHETFASASTNIYAILLIIELILFLNPEWLKNKYLLTLKPVLISLKKLFSKIWFLRLIALLGALSISLTGLLGGIMVYGVSADPLAAPILKLLGL